MQQDREVRIAGFVLDRRVTVGEVLTSLTILFSVITLAVSLYQERVKDRKEHADRVRLAAADALSRLERWRELSSSQNFEQVFVETGEALARTRDARQAGDFLWKGLVRQQAETDARIAEEKIEVAPVEIYSYNPQLHEVFNCTVRKMRDARRESFAKLLTDAQGVLTRSDPKEWERAESLGRELRGALGGYRESLHRRIDPPLKSVHQILMDEIISREDDAVAERRFSARFKCEE